MATTATQFFRCSFRIQFSSHGPIASEPIVNSARLSLTREVHSGQSKKCNPSSRDIDLIVSQLVWPRDDLMNIEEVISIRQTNFPPDRLPRVLSAVFLVRQGPKENGRRSGSNGRKGSGGLGQWRHIDKQAVRPPPSQRNELIPVPFDMEMRQN